MYQDSSEQAAKYLREAVPLMVKHKIPPTPYNYAIWYSYVTNRNPELKTAIDDTIENHGTCPSSATEELFRSHIIGDQIADSEAVQQGLKAVISELRAQVDAALVGAEDFHQLLEASSTSLELSPERLDLGALIGTLSQGTQNVSDTTWMFKRRMAEAQQEVEQLKQELKLSQQEAERDPLSGLYNRRYFERQVKQLLSQEVMENYCLIIVDIDHFKKFNDNYGHLIGDRVIQSVAQMLQKFVADTEMAVRFGGEEFLLLVREQNLSIVLERAENVRKQTQGIVLKDRRAGKDISRITASFGVSQYRAGDTLGGWIERADKALYRAKRQGRNQVVADTDAQ
ncbi:MAG: GGDEF domain-containing protein [Motiliproteus sp.]